MAQQKSYIKCGHCGSKASFEVRSIYSYGVNKWRILQCLACSMPTFDVVGVLFNGNTGNAFESEPITLYPTAKTPLTDLPPMIEKEYEQALKVRSISPVACAVLARRTLEAIFIHEQASGRSLNDKVDSLIHLDRIPSLVGQMAHIGRKIGNIGAHFSEGENVSEEDVKTMLDFLETILEYLYVVPAKVAKVEARFNKTA